ncbi:MAG: ERCC4 domain-containing protein [Candidatus Micrarchaeia archaeon]
MINRKIIVDYRERNVDILDSLDKEGIEVEFQNLPVGDYLISDKICIERKTIQDFEKSIIDGRLFDQLKRIKEVYEQPILIIEGTDNTSFKLSKNVIDGTTIAAYIDYKIQIIYSLDSQDTAKIISMILKRANQDEKAEPSIKGGARAYTNKDFQLQVIGNLPGIGTKLAKKLLVYFGNIKNIANANVEDFMKVDKIGKKKAENIYNIINEHYIEIIDSEENNKI